MSHLPFTLLAYLLNSIAVTIDKILLTERIKNPLIYTFYISLFSLVALLALPFTHIPSTSVLLLASLSTIFWTLGAYSMFKALKVGLLTRVIPAIGTLTPLILLLVAFFSQNLLINEIWAASFLILGLIFLTLTDWKGKLSLEEILLEVLASVFFALSYLFLKDAFLNQDFLTVLVWSRFVLLPLGVVILLIPYLRNQLFSKKAFQMNFFNKISVIFLFGQAAGGLSQLLLTFSISLANPALVNSLQGTQYIFLLIFSIILYKKFPQAFKKPSFLGLIPKILGILLIALGLYMLSFQPVVGGRRIDQSPDLGVTFSPRYAQRLGLDPKATFLKMLDDLSLKRVRLPIYWDEVESISNQFNFDSLNFYLNEAFKKRIEVILVLGQKQPRWPECFEPGWVRDLPFEEKKRQVLRLITAEVNYFKNFPNITIWQVENEPLLNYGICDSSFQSQEFLKEEIDLVKSLDKRPILITDSGELSLWIDSIKDADLFGLSVYRSVWTPYLGLQNYPLPPVFYSIKDSLARQISHNQDGLTIISELQAEPWLKRGMDITKSSDQLFQIFPPQRLQDHFEFAKQTNFAQIYFWGVEWWYLMDKNGYPQYLEYAKSIFK